jgi:hypothetical protein
LQFGTNGENKQEECPQSWGRCLAKASTQTKGDKDMERNEFMEMDGLVATTETHEWFHDKVATQHAQRENQAGISLPNLRCFVVRNIKTGEYDRVIIDMETNLPIYDTKSIDEMGVYIDQLKIIKQFNI